MLTRLLLAATLCFPLSAQEAGVPVIIDGKEILRVYSAVGPFSATDRAQAIEARIVAFGQKGFTGDVTTREAADRVSTSVIAATVVIMGVTEGDAKATGVPRDELAKRYAASIKQALETYRIRHSWTNLLISTAQALFAWCLFIAFVWAIWKALAWLSVRIRAWTQRQASARAALGMALMIGDRSALILLALVKFCLAVVLLFQFSFLISFTFGLFPLTAGVSTTLLEYLQATFAGIAKAVVDYLPSGGFVLIVFLLARWVIKVLKFLAQAVERGDLPIHWLQPEMARPTYQLARFLVISFALVVAFPYLPGAQSEAFKGMSIFLGVLISFGSSSAVSNSMAGLVLTYMRPFRVGDRVMIADNVGDVLHKSLLVTRLRTIKNVEVVIPNSAVLGTRILNYSALARTQGLILNTTVTIGYDAPWRTVHELLIEAARSTAGILADPAPFVLQTSLNDFHISYELNAYTDQANEMANTYALLHQSIQDSFNKAGVEIMSPTFYALRDGNTVTIPESDRPPGYEPPSFRVKT